MSDKSVKNLYELQSLMAAAIMRPLDNDRMKEIWLDGTNTSKYAEQFIKPGKQLTSFERLEIYNKQYWYRLLESLQDDFPGLNSVLGHKRFEKLSIAYLSLNPSYSYTLNDLGTDLANFIRKEPFLCAPDTELAYDMASFEWAEIKAFEAPARPRLKVESLQKSEPSEISLRLQPSLNILELKYEIASFLLGFSKDYTTTKSNAINSRTVRFSKSAYVKKRRNYVAIHRLNNIVYYKRLDKDQYFLLKSLLENQTLAQACNELIRTKNNKHDQEKLALKINKSFTTWMELGWFC